MTVATDQHTNNIVVGAGELYLDLLNAAGATTGERYIGDAVGATISVQTEYVQVFSGTGPIAEPLVDDIRSVSYVVTIGLRDMSMENLRLFFVGSTATVVDVAAEVVDEVWNVMPGRWYQLGTSDTAPSGVGKIKAAVSVKKGTTGSMTHIVDTDYVVDAGRGRLYIVPDGGINAPSVIRVTYTPTAQTRTQVRTGDPKNIRVAWRYLEVSGIGQGRHFYAPQCSVAPSGEMALASRDTEQQASLALRVLERGAGQPSLIIDGEAT